MATTRRNAFPRALFPMNADVAAQEALDRLAKAGFNQLTAQEKVVAAVWTFEAQVANRGLRKYFASEAGDLAYFVPAAFDAIGAPSMADFAAEANGLFGAKGPPRDRTERQTRMQAFDEQIKKSVDGLETRFFEETEDVDELLEGYANRH